MKKNILYITTRFPYPTDSGGNIKTYNTIQTLSKKFNIHLVTFNPSQVNKNDIKHLKKYTTSLSIFINKRIGQSVKNFPKVALINYFQLKPHLFFEYWDKNHYEELQNKIKKINPSVIHIDHINLAEYLPKIKNQIWVLESHNIEYKLTLSRIFDEYRFKRVILMFLETLCIYLFEKKWTKVFDAILAISEDDYNYYSKNYLTIKKLKYFPVITPNLVGSKRKQLNQLLFIGDLHWPPNENAIKYFCDEIFPSVHKLIPTTSFIVIGKRNKFLQKNLKYTKNVYFKGYKNDISKYLLSANVFVLPFRSGAGTRIKALKALSYKIPIVSTKIGISGISQQNKKFLFQTNSKQKFANMIVTLLKKPYLAEYFSKNGTQYLLKNHSKKNNKNLVAFYFSLLN